MIPIKSLSDIKVMKEGGVIAAKALQSALYEAKVGVTLRELDAVVERVLQENGATGGFKTVGGYGFSTCINVNEGIVHGIPGGYKIRKGDLVSIDLGAYYRGFHTDLAYTIEVETKNETDFLLTGKKALEAAISQCKDGNHLGDISGTIQETVEKAGYSVSLELVGHGIGLRLHEPPQVPCYGKKGKGVTLREGMVLAIEVIYQKGSPALVLAEDGWTLETEDGSLSALFEHTVAITEKEPEILTKQPDEPI